MLCNHPLRVISRFLFYRLHRRKKPGVQGPAAEPGFEKENDEGIQQPVFRQQFFLARASDAVSVLLLLLPGTEVR